MAGSKGTQFFGCMMVGMAKDCYVEDDHYCHSHLSLFEAYFQKKRCNIPAYSVIRYTCNYMFQ